MPSGNEVGRFTSYLIYFLSIFAATGFAHLSAKYACKKKDGAYRVNRLFWALSSLALFLPLAFRGFGVDHGQYVKMYNGIQSAGASFFSSYSGVPEPLFAVLIFVVTVSGGHFQWVYIIASFLSLGLLYTSFSRYVKRVSLGMLIWVFGFSYYIFMYGLVRISIAVGITTYALKYLESSNKYRYSLLIITAALFHYSAIIMIPVYYLVTFASRPRLGSGTKVLSYSIALMASVPLLFALIQYLFPALFSGVWWYGRYSAYFNSKFDWRVINNVAVMFPLLILVFMYRNAFASRLTNGEIHIRLFLTMMAFAVASTYFPIIRVTYYFYPSAYYLYAAVGRFGLWGPTQFDRARSAPIYIFCMGLLGFAWLVIVRRYRFCFIPERRQPWMPIFHLACISPKAGISPPGWRL